MSSTQQYIVSARKYRPSTFRSVVGQKALTATLKNAIAGNKLAQAYLFCGPRGVGKTSCARIFAKTINCMNPTPDGEACGKCESCMAIDKGNSFNLVELDAASNNSVENIRNITDQVNIPPQDGRYRVFIIDEVHMLSNSAFNAFLKTLEEPPKNVVFILATTERHKVIPTILSRCQIYDFRRITVNDIIEHLEYVAQSEGVKADREALGVIAMKADGAMRDALSIFDQVVASTHGNVTYQGTLDSLNVLDQGYYFKLVDIFKKGDVAEALLTFKEITDKGFDALFFVNGLASHIRNLMVCADPRTISLLETSEEWEKKYAQQSSQLPVDWYYNAMKLLNDTDYNYKTSGNKRLLVELALIRLCRLLTPPAAPFVAPDVEKPHPAPAPQKEAKAELNVVKEPAPALKPAEPAPVKPVQSFRSKSFRLSVDLDKGKDYKEVDQENNPFSEEDLKQAWTKFIDAHPEQRILISAMRSSLPQKKDETTYRVSVNHPAQKQSFENVLSELTEFLRRELKNGKVKLEVDIEKEPEGEKILNPREFLKLVVDENKELADFLKSIDAELE